MPNKQTTHTLACHFEITEKQIKRKIPGRSQRKINTPYIQRSKDKNCIQCLFRNHANRKSVEWSVSPLYIRAWKWSPGHKLSYWRAHIFCFSSQASLTSITWCSLSWQQFSRKCHLLLCEVIFMSRNTCMCNSQWYYLLKCFDW